MVCYSKKIDFNDSTNLLKLLLLDIIFLTIEDILYDFENNTYVFRLFKI